MSNTPPQERFCIYIDTPLMLDNWVNASVLLTHDNCVHVGVEYVPASTIAQSHADAIAKVEAGKDARLLVPVEFLVEGKREAFAAGAMAMHAEILALLKEEK